MKIDELDLHGERHPDVNRIVENFVLLNNTPMNIITGRSDKMKELVINVLSKYRFQYYQFFEKINHCIHQCRLMFLVLL